MTYFKSQIANVARNCMDTKIRTMYNNHFGYQPFDIWSEPQLNIPSGNALFTLENAVWQCVIVNYPPINNLGYPQTPNDANNRLNGEERASVEKIVDLISQALKDLGYTVKTRQSPIKK